MSVLLDLKSQTIYELILYLSQTTDQRSTLANHYSASLAEGQMLYVKSASHSLYCMV
jgi:hypothetical protein